MESQKISVFISYIPSSRDYALGIYDLLFSNDKCEPWISDQNVLLGQDWRVERKMALEDSDVHLIIINGDSSESSFQKDEIIRILSLDKDRKYIIPLFTNAIYLSDNLKNFKGIYLDRDNSYQEKLLSGLDSIHNLIYSKTKSLGVVDVGLKDFKSNNYRILKVVLKNIRCFNSLEVSLEDDCNWLMILGDNASGKSTLLKSISIGLCNETEAITLMSLDGGKFITRGEEEGEITMQIVETSTNVENTITTLISKDPTSGEEIVRKKLSNNFDLHDIFICGYGTNRSNKAVESFDDYEKITALKSLFSTDAKLQNPELVLLRRDDSIRKMIEGKLLEILMLDSDKYKVEYSDKGLKLMGPWGSENFRSLSDGYRTTSQWILDFISWAVYANKFSNNSDFGGILIIDELELQLHPQWQKEIVKRMRIQFPNVQIISTTHTPLIAGGIADIDKAKLIRFKLTSDGEIVTYYIDNDSLYGLTSNEILNSIAFEVHMTKNSNSVSDIGNYLSLKQKETLSEEERSRMEELKEQIVEDDTLQEGNVDKGMEKKVVSFLDKTLEDVDPELIELDVKNKLRNLFKSKK